MSAIAVHFGEQRTLENAQVMAAHDISRTIKHHGRAGDEITLDEIERILI